MQEEIAAGIKKEKIGVVGMWHLGEIFSAGLADIGHAVTGFDAAPEVISKLKIGQPPLDEPDLPEMIKRNIALGRLSYTADFSKLAECSVVWVAFDTPINDQDEVQLQPIWDFFKQQARYFKNKVLIIISSQVPVGTCEAIEQYIRKLNPLLTFDLAYVPENLQLGKAVKSFLEPGRIVIGACDKKIIKRVVKIFKILPAEILSMSLASAEMSKHALNAFLATSLSFIYDIADISEAEGADVADVARALRSDPRIGSGAYLDASLGFSGGTLARDIKILMRRGLKKKVALPVITSVFEKNKVRRALVISYLRRALGSLQGKKIALFGLTYKSGTSTLRRALSLEIANLLHRAGARVQAYDPGANHSEVERQLPTVRDFDDPYAAVSGCQAIVFITDWPQFQKLNFKKLQKAMVKPAVFFDTRNTFRNQDEYLKKQGFTYIGIGRAPKHR